MGAGILPTTIHNNKIHFLFGKESKYDSTPGWSDFAGGNDNNENQMETAVREGTEELTGFLGTEKELKKMLSKYGTYNVDWNTYRTHVFPMEYNECLVHYYNNNQAFLQRKLEPSVFKKYKIFEKAEIRWVPFDKLKKMRGQFRSFYRNVVDLLLENRPQIEKFIRGSLKREKGKKTLCNCCRHISLKNKTRKNKK